MHEYSLIRGLLKQVEGLCRDHRADYVAGVRLTVGDFSGVEADLLQSAFEELSQGTIAEGATLEVTRTSLSARCTNCMSVFRIRDFHFVCTTCGSRAITIQQGEEILLESVKMVCREKEGSES